MHARTSCLLRSNFLIYFAQEREDPTLTDWDRFARAEYVRLSMEEEGEYRGSDNQNELWVQQNLEGPF